LLTAMTEAGITKSTGEARKLVKSGGVRLNDVVVQDERMDLDYSAALYGRYFVLRRGKKNYHLLVNSQR
jgi:tyrosyl-tRNA synthetase